MRALPPYRFKLHLIRHAESTANVTTNVGGVDAKLTERGLEQAQQLGEFLKASEIPFDRVHSSTYERARHTAEIAMRVLGDKRVVLFDKRLVEIGRGEWDGKPIAEVITPAVRKRMEILGMDYRTPGGESMNEVSWRMSEWLLDKIVGDPEAETETLTHLVFSHGHAIRCLLQRVLGNDPWLTWKIRLNNTSVTTLIHDSSGWSIEQLNAMPKLVNGPWT